MYMKNLINLFLCFCMVLLTVCFAGCDNNQNGQNARYLKVVGLGDSISAGYSPQNTSLYSYYNDYISNNTKINEMCYTNIVANNFVDEKTFVSAKSYATSGDTSANLVNKLQDSKSYPDILSDIKNANIITLCIGANNVLIPAINSLNDYVAGNITLDYIESLLIQGYEQFRDDYTNQIMNILPRTKGYIFVMTVYDAYKYLDLTEANINQMFASNLAQINQAFNEIKELTVEYLNKINDYIRNEKYNNVFVVDVNIAFEGLTKTDYLNYINADSTKITIADLMNLKNSSNFDPHPTLDGQMYIAGLFQEKINQVFGIKQA